MTTVVFTHPSPGAAHGQLATLLSAFWGCSVRFGSEAMARSWDDSGWLDAPSFDEPPSRDALAWIWWRTRYWAAGLPVDAHGRPQGHKADRNLGVPEAELRARSLAVELGLSMSPLTRPKPVVVVDIDHLFAYRGRGRLAHWGGFVRDALRADVHALRQRAFGPDPFFSLSHWADVARRYPNCSLQFFALLAGRKGPYDRGVLPNDPEVAEALRTLALRFEVGAHLSYASHDRVDGFREELRFLDRILGAPTLRQRVHFLRNAGQDDLFDALEALGVREDWSDEFADVPGFRSGWASSFAVRTGLVQVPVAVMDQNVLDRSPREVADLLHELQESAWSVGAPLRVGTHWRIFGPRPAAERNAKDFAVWREGLDVWLKEQAV